MNVLNMFQEEQTPVITKPVQETKPAYAFTPDPNWGQEPITELPGDNKAIQQTLPEPTDEDRIKAKLEEIKRTGGNAIYSLIDQGTPVLDEKKAQRLKFAAATNALGQGLSTLFGGVMGAKGGPILEQRNDFAPAALAEYNQMVAADKDAQYRNAMAKSQLAGKVFEMAKNDIDAENQRKFSRETQKSNQDFQASENEKQRVAAKELRAMNNGMSADDRIRIDNNRYEKMSEANKVKYNYMMALQQMKLAGIELTYQQKKELEDYKAAMEKVTTESTSYDNGKETKTKKETTVNPNVKPKASQNTSSDPDDEFLAK